MRRGESWVEFLSIHVKRKCTLQHCFFLLYVNEILSNSHFVNRKRANCSVLFFVQSHLPLLNIEQEYPMQSSALKTFTLCHLPLQQIKVESPCYLAYLHPAVEIRRIVKYIITFTRENESKSWAKVKKDFLLCCFIDSEEFEQWILMLINL